MSMRLVDVKEAKKILTELQGEIRKTGNVHGISGTIVQSVRPCVSAGVQAAKAALDRMSTIEAEPVRHAQWINDTFCSNCKRFPVDVSVSISNQELTKYFSRCPHCGAKMDGEGK